MSELWVERHRPQTVGDIKGQRAVVDPVSYTHLTLPTILLV